MKANTARGQLTIVSIEDDERMILVPHLHFNGGVSFDVAQNLLVYQGLATASDTVVHPERPITKHMFILKITGAHMLHSNPNRYISIIDKIR